MPDEQIQQFVEDANKTDEVIKAKEDRSGVCYIRTRIYHTSNDLNEMYELRAWNLHIPGVLQQASVQECELGSQGHFSLHRVKVLRAGVIVDKAADVTVRVLDDERESAAGMIKKAKKAHCIISDLRIDDVLIWECSFAEIFDENSYLDKRYCRCITFEPSSFWFYSHYRMTVISQRSEDLCIRARYFRDENGDKISHEDVVVRNGDRFTFEKTNYLTNIPDDVFPPFFEIATVATWKRIATNIHELYSDIYQRNSFDVPEQLSKRLQTAASIADKIRYCIDFVQDEIVYLVDAEVMHRHVPQSPQDVMATKSGDCKSKSFFLVALLEAIGVEARCILVNYQFDNYIEDSLPSPFVFNHEIVKIIYEEIDYFIDPTQSNCAGTLEYRTQPHFVTYLELGGSNTLLHREDIPNTSWYIEERTRVNLQKGKGSIEIRGVYRRDSADIERANIRFNSKEQMIRHKNNVLRGRLLYEPDKNDTEVFANADYVIVSDDREINELTVSHKVDLLAPLSDSNEYQIFRYYYPVNTNNLLSLNHRDAYISSFMSFPSYYSDQITSTRIVAWWDENIRRDLVIDNNYFHFSNKKKTGLMNVEVHSLFKPKTFGIVKREDLPGVRRDIQKILDSNYGIGLAFAS